MAKTARRVVIHRHTVSQQLRDVIDSRGLTPYAVAKEAGIDPGMVARFVSGERDLRLGTVDRIAAALGLRLVEVGRSKARAPRPVAPTDKHDDSHPM
jgi:transcriptional regulator with XRE-family HTH domain